ncbi:hypothetical protein ACNKHT_01025 [Shigella flexneri]
MALGSRYGWADQNLLTALLGQPIKRDDKQFTWRGGVNYLFDNGVTLYSAIANRLNLIRKLGKDGNISHRLKVKRYEVGVKYVPENSPIVVTGAVYNLTKTNNLMADPGDLFSVEGGEIRRTSRRNRSESSRRVLT